MADDPLLLENLVDCPECGTTFDVVYEAPPGVEDVEDLIDAPSQLVTCPACGNQWERDYEGWLAHDDAG